MDAACRDNERLHLSRCQQDRRNLGRPHLAQSHLACAEGSGTARWNRESSSPDLRRSCARLCYLYTFGLSPKPLMVSPFSVSAVAFDMVYGVSTPTVFVNPEVALLRRPGSRSRGTVAR